MTEDVSQTRYVRWAFIALAVAALFIFFWQIRSVMLYGLAATLLVILVEIPVSGLVRLRLPRSIAIIITLIGFAFISGILTMLILPTLIDQFVILGNQITRGIEEAVEYWNSGQLQEQFPALENIDFLDGSDEARIDINTIREVTREALDTLGELSGSIVPFIGGVASTLLNVVIVIFLAIFLLADPTTYRNGFVKLVPLWYRPRVEHILNRLHNLLRRWLFAQMFGMLITGVGTFIGLSLIGLEQAAALAIVTAFASFVPNFGELLAVAISLAVAAVQAPDRLVFVVFVIYGVSFIQGQIIGPLVASESVKIPPVLILVGQIVVARFFGVLGIILAVPILTITVVLVQEMYIIDVLGDKEEEQLVMEHETEPMSSPAKGKVIPDGV